MSCSKIDLTYFINHHVERKLASFFKFLRDLQKKNLDETNENFLNIKNEYYVRVNNNENWKENIRTMKYCSLLGSSSLPSSSRRITSITKMKNNFLFFVFIRTLYLLKAFFDDALMLYEMRLLCVIRNVPFM